MLPADAALGGALLLGGVFGAARLLAFGLAMADLLLAAWPDTPIWVMKKRAHPHAAVASSLLD